MNQNKSKVVLIVDDEDDVRLLVSRHIQNQFACEILEASSAKDSILKLQKYDVDLVLCDYEMPDISGIAVAKYLVNNNFKTKLIFYTSSEISKNDLVHGGTNFLVVNKPLINSLIEKISNLMNWKR
ncbi:MAG: response regulator [Pseudobdellovibrionaceae bacterium]